MGWRDKVFTHRDDAPSRVYILQLMASTLPLLIVLCYFLYIAHERPKDPYYSDDDVEQYQDDVIMAQIAEPKFNLMEMLWVFLTILFLWTWLALYLGIFVNRRRMLMRYYLDVGETVKGDVLFDDDMGCCDIKPSWLIWNCSACCGINSKNYSDLVYTVTAEKDDGQSTTERVVVTKCVRVYKPWVREKIAILVLPGLPQSGLPKSCVETDVKGQGRNRIADLYVIIGFWIIFLLLGSLYVVRQIGQVHDELYHSTQAWIILGCFVVLGLPVAYVMNEIQFRHYKRWLTNSGTMEVDDGTGGGDLSSSLVIGRGKNKKKDPQRDSSKDKRAAALGESVEEDDDEYDDTYGDDEESGYREMT